MLKNLTVALTAALLLGAGPFLIGCSSSEPGASEPSAPSAASADGDWKAGLDTEVVTALSELSEADRTAALSQKVCPVADKSLGSMGKPVKVTVKDRDVFLCCDACRDTINADPDKYLAKLSEE